MKDLLAEFMPRFRAVARDRIQASRTHLAEGRAAKLEHELHQLAGEAAMLGIEPVAELARRCEAATRSWATNGAGADECARLVEELASAVEALDTPDR